MVFDFISFGFFILFSVIFCIIYYRNNIYEKRDQFPLLIMIIIIWALYLNNMPVNFSIGSKNILTLSNLNIMIFILILITMDLKKGGTIVSNYGIFFVMTLIIYGIAFIILQIKDIKNYLKKNNIISDVMIYNWEYALINTLISTLIFILLTYLYNQILNGNDTGNISIFIFILGLIFLYLKTDGVVSIIADIYKLSKTRIEKVIDFVNQRHNQ